MRPALTERDMNFSQHACMDKAIDIRAYSRYIKGCFDSILKYLANYVAS